LSYFDELKRKIQVEAYEKIADAWKAKLLSMNMTRKQLLEDAKS